MPVAVDEGHGASIALGTHTWDTAALITSITFDGISRQSLETSNLVTANARTYMPEDLPDYGTLTVEFLHIDAIAPPYAVAETVTVTYPIGSGQSVAATIAFSGFLLDYTPGSPAIGEIMQGSAKWKVTGVMTFTAAT
jgi:hypothetical protein